MCAELIQLGFQRIAVRTHLRGIYLTSRCDILWLGGEAQVPELQLVVGHPNLVAFDLRHERLHSPPLAVVEIFKRCALSSLVTTDSLQYHKLQTSSCCFASVLSGAGNFNPT